MLKSTILMISVICVGLCLSFVVISAAAEEDIYFDSPYFVHVNHDNYQQQVLDSQDNIIVMFNAKWCPFSTTFMPIYESLAKKYKKNVKFCSFELDQTYGDFNNPETFKKWYALRDTYNVTVVPTFIMYSKGKEIDRMRGRPRQSIILEYKKYLKDWIYSNLIKKDKNPYVFNNKLILRKKFQE